MHKPPTMFSIMKKALIASSCLMLACSNALANTWLFVKSDAKISNAWHYTMSEADDDGNIIDGGWSFDIRETNAQTHSCKVVSVVTNGFNSVLDFTLPRSANSPTAYITGFDANVLKGKTVLTEVILMDSCTSGNYLFQNCSNLERISVGTMSWNTQDLSGCTKLKEIYCRKAVPGVNKTFTKGLPDGHFRYYVEDATLTDFSVNFTPYDKDNPPSANLSYAKYTEKFDDGTVPSYTRNANGSDVKAQWVTIKPFVTEDKYLAISGERTSDGAKAEYGTVTPGYHGLQKETEFPLTCSVDESDKVVVVDNIRYEAYAYVLSESENSLWVRPVTNETLTCTYNPADTIPREIKWLWRPVGYAVDVVYPEELGTVTATAPAADGLYDAGTTVTLTATPIGDAVFEKWAGDIGDADPTAATIQVTADQYRKIIPIFQSKTWWLTDGNKKLTDGYWTNTVTVTDDIISLGSFAGKPSLGGVTVLDFAKNKSLPAGYRIVAIPGAFLSKNEANMPDVTEVYLPSTVTNIGGRAFYNQGLLRVFEPLLPKDLSVVGHQILYGCSALHGTVTLGYTDTPITFVPHGGNFKDATFHSSGIEHFDFGPAVTNLTEQMFYSSSGIQTVILPRTLQEIRNYAFAINKTKQVEEIRFKGGVPALTGGPFDNWVANKTLFEVPYGNASWNAILKDSDKVTPWGELDATAQATFKANFPEIRKPYGLLKSGALPSLAKDEWIVEWPLASGTQIILK